MKLKIARQVKDIAAVAGSVQLEEKQKLQSVMVNSPLFELARLLVCLDHITRVIKNANHSIVGAAQ